MRLLVYKNTHSKNLTRGLRPIELLGCKNTKYDTASDDDDGWFDASVVDGDGAKAYAEGSVFRSQAGAGSTVDDPGGGIDDPGGGDIDDLGSLDNLADRKKAPASKCSFPGHAMKQEDTKMKLRCIRRD